jgi:hypothetical protein
MVAGNVLAQTVGELTLTVGLALTVSTAKPESTLPQAPVTNTA